MSKFDITAAEILRQECFQPENVKNTLSGIRNLTPFGEENPYKDILKKLSDIADYLNIEPKLTYAPSGESHELINQHADEISARLKEYDTKISRLKKNIDDNKAILKQTEFLASLDVDIRDILELQHIKFRFGRIRKQVYKHIGYFKLMPFQQEENIYKGTVTKLRLLSRKYGFEIDTTSPRRNETPESINKKLDELEAAITKCNAAIDGINARIAENELILRHIEAVLGCGDDACGLEECPDSDSLKLRFGYIAKKDAARLYELTDSEEMAGKLTFVRTGEEEDRVYGMYLVGKKHEDTVDTRMMSAGFEFIHSSRKTRSRLGEFLRDIENSLRQERTALETAARIRCDNIAEMSDYVNGVITGISVMSSETDPKTQRNESQKIGISGWMSEDKNPFLFMETGSDEEYVWGVYFAPNVSIEYAETMFASLQFEWVRIYEKARGKPDEVKANILAELKGDEKQLEALLAERARYGEESAAYIDSVFSYLILLSKSTELKKSSVRSADNFYMSGWVADEDFFSFVNALETIGDIKYIVENSSFLKAKAPTKLRNLRIFKPFESFIRMYGVPGYNEIDPTPLVAISYMLFFGIMFGDFGQGAVIALIGAFLWFAKKVMFGKILMSCGASSMLFGLVYDSIFGYEGMINRYIFGHDQVVVGYSPSHDMIKTLLITVSMGVLFIAFVMILNIYNGIRQRDYEKALFGHNGVAGLILYTAAIWLVADKLLLGNTAPVSKAYIICFFVLPLVVVFFRHPLANIVKREHKIFEGSIFEFIIENFFELFDVLLSFVTNTVSFVRVGAFALSHAGMMFVVFLLANTTPMSAFGSGNLLVVIVGNIVIMGLEGLVVGIQGLRLEFYELFSRFYSGDGVDFAPMKIDNSK